jgi:hypothetical protein
LRGCGGSAMSEKFTICAAVGRMRIWIAALLALVIFVGAVPSFAHVGNPDVYFQGAAGPYHLIVTVRTPQMIPGVASVEVISATPGITKISVVPTYIVGPGAKYPPEGDGLAQGKDDPQYFSGKIWLMASGSWQVRLKVDGAQGAGELAVPVPAAARATLPMARGLGILLLALMLLLVAAFIAIMGAATREAAVEPGAAVPPRNRLRARIAMGIATALVVALLVTGNAWWNSTALANAARKIYAAPKVEVKLGDGGRTMQLDMIESKWHSRRPETVTTELIPDHGYLMHLFLVREPGLDVFYHLHPKMLSAMKPKAGDDNDDSDSGYLGKRDGEATNVFKATLPSMPPGKYQVYADVVRASGFPDTMTAEIDVPAHGGVVDFGIGGLTGDDSMAVVLPDRRLADGPDGPVFTLADGYKMVWVRGSAPLVANQFVWLKFRLEDPQGKPVTDGEPYMGMAGHTEIVSADRSVFAHIHPDGSAAMAAVEMANAPAANTAPQTASPMPAGMDPAMKMPMDVMTGQPSAEVSFPYGFPKAGRYRIFAQMKRGGVIETGVFDADVVAGAAAR